MIESQRSVRHARAGRIAFSEPVLHDLPPIPEAGHSGERSIRIDRIGQGKVFTTHRRTGELALSRRCRLIYEAMFIVKDRTSMFARITAQPLFPSTIWIHHVEPDVAVPLNDRLAREIDRLISPKPPRAPGETWQTAARLQNLPAFQPLMDIFRKAAKGVLDQLCIEYGEFEITGSWANVNPKGGIHHVHNHPNNYLSGVYYVQIPAGADAIQFHDPRQQVTMISPRVTKYNMYNSIVANVQVSPGQLILFPAWLVHSVEPNPDDQPRISISFNIMFSDYVKRMSYPKWDGIPIDRK